ncbi:hypothetical protein X882_5853 [Burkholderia pseudomallei MSHR4303]|nr:hypothetical protein X882_5853 [Burkholderia pseudomallei MSHR4303]
MHEFKWVGFANSNNEASTTIADAMRKIDLFLCKSRLFICKISTQFTS